MEISIVIPTYNRAKILDTSLKRIFSSNFPKSKYEVLVINDASNDETEEVCLKWQKLENLKYHKQKKAGQGVARNTGIDMASGKIIIFEQDDIYVTKNFLQEHYKIHQKHPAKNFGCLGLILWDPEIEISNLMKWSTNEITFFNKFGGHQFAFNHLKENQIADYNYFYTSNLSIKKEILVENQFDPWFDGYGWEDIELGYRLQKKEDLKLVYNPQAVAYHHHEISQKDFQNRMTQIGTASHLFNKKHPELNKIPTGLKLQIFKIISNEIIILPIKILNKFLNNKLVAVYYYCLSKKYYLEGLNIIPDKLK